ncbi:MAG: hypothetical protein GY869_26590, partial [Planctomycetes bacterium]|nr:hypothetical protein [Planctomycetota bacterium]
MKQWLSPLFAANPGESGKLWQNFLAFNLYGDPGVHILEPQARRYVDADAAAGGDGKSWTTAYNDLQDGLADVPAEVWVAEGTYKPDRGTGNRASTFQLINNVSIYGGFDGDETTLFQRDPVNNVTILSGDLDGDDGADFLNNSENSYHVVTGSNTNATAVLDGFTITGGNASSS